MKKLLLLAGLLVVASSAFAAEPPKTEATGEVKIYAQVLTDLSVDTEPLNFGILGISDSKTVQATDSGAGKFTVTGATNTNISLTITDPNDAQNKFTNGEITAKLVRDGGGSTTANDILTPKIHIFENGKEERINNTTFTIASNSQLHMAQPKEFKVGGDITTKGGQNTGNYQGAIKVTAKYDSWPAAVAK